MTRVITLGAIAVLAEAIVGCNADRVPGTLLPAQRHATTRPALSLDWEWTDPIEAGVPGSPTISGISPALSPDGLRLYFTAVRDGGQGGFDIWVASRASICDGFATPVNLGPTINSAAREQGAFISPDGHLLFFMRGNALLTEGDIYLSRRTNVHDDSAWESPVLLGSGVNTAALETEPWFVRPGSDDDTGLLYFGRGANNLSQDFYVARVNAQGETIGEAIPVVELNSTGIAPLGNEDGIAVAKNGREVIFASRRFPEGFAELFTSTRPNVDSDWRPPELLASLNTGRPEVHPALSDDGRTLAFSSARTGDFRIFVSRRGPPGEDSCR